MQIRIDSIDFSSTSVPVLNDTSLDLDGPGFVSILGPHGSRPSMVWTHHTISSAECEKITVI